MGRQHGRGKRYPRKGTIMTKELKALIEDLRLNHEYCPKEVILQAANELERLSKPEQEQEPVQYKCTVIDDQHPNGIPL